MRRRLSAEANFLVDLKDHPSKPERIWLRERAVDSRFAYLSRASVDGWEHLKIHGHNYDVYKNCKSVLDAFLRDDKAWNDLIDARALGGITILGAGASDKDIAILNNLVGRGYFEEGNDIKYVIFDNSFFMLTETTSVIEETITTKHLGGKVELIPCCGDFLNSPLWRSEIRPYDDTSVAFFVLGATIGNVNERLLFESLADVAEPNDILVIGNDFQLGSESETKLELNEIYNTEDAKDFVLTAVNSFLDHHALSRDKNERRSWVHFDTEHASRLPIGFSSSLPGTLAAVYRLTQTVEGVKNLVLSASKKYTEEALNALAAEFGFEHQNSHMLLKKPAAKTALSYRYMVFSFKPST